MVATLLETSQTRHLEEQDSSATQSSLKDAGSGQSNDSPQQQQVYGVMHSSQGQDGWCIVTISSLE